MLSDDGDENGLENSAHGSATKEKIQKLHDEKKVRGSIQTVAANMLEATIHTGFHDPHKFIHEILQNADDADATAIVFNLSDNYLLISYDGAPFQENDVERICDACAHNSADKASKVHNPNKVGYKGIGFKSVFCISEKVTVVSGGWQFRFDKSYWDQPQAHEDGFKTPWQIIPNVVEDADIEHVIGIKDKAVSILLENFIVDIKAIAGELRKICRQHDVMIFLDSIKSINFEYHGKRVNLYKKIFMDDGYVMQETTYSGRRNSSVRKWCMYTEDNIQVPTHIHDDLQRLSHAECPQKIKQASHTKITFCGELNTITGEEQLRPSDTGRLYCALPTAVTSGLHYSVNANFLLNQDRTSILNNAWNGFLLEIIGYLQFKWLAFMAKHRVFGKSILNLISDNNILYDYPKMATSYNVGFDKGINAAAFIPSIDGNFLRLRDIIIDETDFFKMFFNDISDDSLIFKEDRRWRLVDPRLEAISISKLRQLTNGYQDNLYQVSQLLRGIESYLEQVRNKPDVMIRIIHFFITYYSRISIDLSSLRQKKIFLTTNGVFTAADDCFLPDNEDEISRKLVSTFSLNMTQRFNNREIPLKGLKAVFGLDTVTYLSFVKRYVLSLVKKGGVNQENTIKLLRCVYFAYKESSEKFTADDFDILSNFPVLCERRVELTPIKYAYWSKKQAFIEPAVGFIISSQYYMQELRNQKDMSTWELLLKSMKINISIQLEVHSYISYTDVTKLVGPELLQRYVGDVIVKNSSGYVGQGAKYSPLNKSFKPDNIEFHHFVFFRQFPLILADINGSDVYQNLMWMAIETDWQKFESPSFYCRKTAGKSKTDKTDKIGIHFLLYCIRTYALVKIAGSDKRAPGSQLIYSPNSLDLMREILPIPDIPVKLNEKQTQMLGFRSYATFQECVALLAGESHQQNARVGNVGKIYMLILASNDNGREILHQWKQGNKLLSLDKRFLPATQLKIFDGEGTAPDPQSQWLNDCGLNKYDMLKLAALFGLSKFADEKRIFVAENTNKVNNRNQYENKIICEIFACLPMVASFEHCHSDKKPQDIMLDALNKILIIEFSYCSSLIKVVGKDVFAHMEDNVLYFHTRVRSIEYECWHGIVNKLNEQLNFSPITVEFFTKLITKSLSLEEVLSSEDKKKEYEELKRLLDIRVKQHQERESAINELGKQLQEMNITKPEPELTPEPGLTPEFPLTPEPELTTVLSDTLVEPLSLLAPSSTPEREDTPPISPKTLRKPRNPGKYHYPKTEPKSEDRETKRRRGHQGEKLVHDRLIDYYQKKYGKIEKIEGKPGELVHRIARVERKGQELEITVTWHDSDLDSGTERLDRDMTIIKTRKAEKTTTEKYIEVKTTKNKESERTEVSLSKNEWVLAMKAKEKYILFFVSNIDGSVPAIRKFKNFSSVLQQALLKHGINSTSIEMSETDSSAKKDFYVDINQLKFYFNPKRFPHSTLWHGKIKPIPFPSFALDMPRAQRPKSSNELLKASGNGSCAFNAMAISLMYYIVIGNIVLDASRYHTQFIVLFQQTEPEINDIYNWLSFRVIDSQHGKVSTTLQSILGYVLRVLSLQLISRDFDKWRELVKTNHGEQINTVHAYLAKMTTDRKDNYPESQWGTIVELLVLVDYFNVNLEVLGFQPLKTDKYGAIIITLYNRSGDHFDCVMPTATREQASQCALNNQVAGFMQGLREDAYYLYVLTPNRYKIINKTRINQLGLDQQVRTDNIQDNSYATINCLRYISQTKQVILKQLFDWLEVNYANEEDKSIDSAELEHYLQEERGVMERHTKKYGIQTLIPTQSKAYISAKVEESPVFGWKISDGHAFFANPAQQAKQATIRLPLSVGNETDNPNFTESKYAKAGYYRVSFFLSTMAGTTQLPDMDIEGVALKSQGFEINIPANTGCDIRIMKI